MRLAPKIALIVVFIFFILLIAYIYYYIELPQQESYEEKAYINIFTYDEDGNKIKTGYKIFVSGSEYTNGSTSFMGGVKESIPINRSVSVINYNLEEQNYYSEEDVFNSENTSGEYRVDLFLRKPGKMVLAEEKKLIDNQDKASFALYATKDTNFLSFCLDRSSNILYSDILSSNFTEIEPPARFEFYDKCMRYEDDILKKDKKVKIEVDFLTFRKLSEEDFIDFVFFDGNKINNEIIYDKDVGMGDFEYSLTK
jgi:cbb3-type cytochrome oxidase subunit 3